MLLGHRLVYDQDTMTGRTARDKEIITRALKSGKHLEVAVYDDGLCVIDYNCPIASAVYATYDPTTMRGKTEQDETAIEVALAMGRKLHVRKEGDEIRVIDVMCYIATAVYKEDSKRCQSL